MIGYLNAFMMYTATSALAVVLVPDGAPPPLLLMLRIVP